MVIITFCETVQLQEMHGLISLSLLIHKLCECPISLRKTPMGHFFLQLHKVVCFEPKHQLYFLDFITLFGSVLLRNITGLAVEICETCAYKVIIVLLSFSTQ